MAYKQFGRLLIKYQAALRDRKLLLFILRGATCTRSFDTLW